LIRLTNISSTIGPVKGSSFKQVSNRIWKIVSNDNSPSHVFAIGANSLTTLGVDIVSCSLISSPLSRSPFSCVDSTGSSAVSFSSIQYNSTSDSSSNLYLSISITLPVNIASLNSLTSFPLILNDILALAVFRVEMFRQAQFTLTTISTSNTERYIVSPVYYFYGCHEFDNPSSIA
jgi:hypothetical protein